MLRKKNVLAFSLLLTLSNLAFADWFTSAATKELITKADAGDMVAQFRVGNIYETGNGAPSSSEKAKKYYLMAANQGYAEAQNSIGSIFQAGKNYAEAKLWYERAAAQNHPWATTSLGYLYDIGLGVPQDRSKGFELYSRAANLGWADAMWNIANMYGAGQLGKTDLVLACVWVVRSQKFNQNQNPRLALQLVRVLPELIKTLTNEEWASCQEQGDSWSPQYAKQ